MKHSIYIRNFIATALIVFISFTMLGGLSTLWNYQRSVSERRLAMTSTLQHASRYLTVYHDADMSTLDVSLWLALVSGISGFDLLVTDVDGVVSACSERDFRQLGKTVPRSALDFSTGNVSYLSLTTLGQIFEDSREVAGTPLTVSRGGDELTFGYLFISSDLETFSKDWRNFASNFILIALNVMALAFIISFIATKKQAEPLNEIAVAVRRFTRGVLSTRVEVTRRYDEIGHLSLAFNAMADSLESSEKLRRDFIANLSHELKTPMTVITGFAEGILDGTIPPENVARTLGVISSETRRLSRLVASMLNVSTLQSKSSENILRMSFDLSEVVRLSLLRLERKIDNSKLDVDAVIPEEAIMTLGDEDSITQVVYNLLDNAIKFSTPGGFIRMELWKQGERAFFSVENRGETIPADEMPHIFDRFHKADRSRSADREGVGLGLYIVKTILDNHNEDIFVDSKDGVTKFVFALSII